MNSSLVLKTFTSEMIMLNLDLLWIENGRSYGIAHVTFRDQVGQAQMPRILVCDCRSFKSIPIPACRNLVKIIL